MEESMSMTVSSFTDGRRERMMPEREGREMS